jgi:N-acetyl-anhydromuramyl-L-alanine amidase AmpD
MTRRFKPFVGLGVGVGVASLVVATLTASTPYAAAQDWSQCLEGSSDTQAVFERAAQASGVPEDLLLAVGYLSSQWRQNHGAPSTSSGYGVMHLTDFAVGRSGGAAKGDTGRGADRAGTLRLAADLTDFAPAQLRADHVANICGGAAVLASYQPATTSQQPADWTKAVASYAGTADEAKMVQYTGQVFDVLRSGAAETTDLGDRVTLAARAGAQPDRAGLEAAGALEPGIDELECPNTIECEAIEALYVQTDPANPRAYVNYDLADRENDVTIDYLVVHDSECDYEVCVRLIQTPDRFVSWQYTVRSADGHVAQHVANHNVAAHAGNWYINMHSVGIEHEGYAAGQGRWYTDSLYRSSAELAKYLAAKYGFQLDRAHVVGHEEFQSSNYKWDPGPYWDWERYMKLLGAPIRPEGKGRRQIVTVKPGYEDNQHAMECPADPKDPNSERVPCPPAGTSFVYMYTAPSESAPLVGGDDYDVEERNSHAVAGHKLFVEDVEGEWIKTWWDGAEAWLHNPDDDKVVVPSTGEYVTPKGSTPVTVYARAYPEQQAYVGTPVPYQGQPTLDAITLKPGQKYVLADKTVPTNYYRATSYFNQLPGDGTVISGQEKYYQVWVGHRFGYVKVPDVDVHTSGRPR